MSIWYSIGVTLNTPFNQKSIKRVLDQGAAVGCQYFLDNTTKEGLYLSTQVTLECIWQEIEQTIMQENSSYLSGSCNISYLETSAFSIFSGRNGLLKILIGPVGGKWYTEPSILDHARYTKLLLDICKDFDVLQLHAEDDGYREDFYYFGKDPQIAFEPNRDHVYPRQQYVVVTITQDISLECITAALNCGIAAGWKFFKPTGDGTLLPLAVDQAVSLIMSTPLQDCFQEFMANDHLISSLWGTIGGRYYGIKIGKRSTGHIIISVIPVDYPHAAVASPFTFHHALRDIFDLCAPFGIIEVTTFDSWYNTYYIPDHKV